MSINQSVDQTLWTTISPLEDRTWLILGIALVPVPLTMLFFSVHSTVSGTPSDAYGLPMAYLIYGLANLFTVIGLYALLSEPERNAVFRFTHPSVTELLWAFGAFIVGLGVYQLTSRVSGMLGYELRGLSYSLSEPSTVVLIVVGAVIIAPITEEVLYRGLVLGVVLSRLGVVSTIVIMTGLFALIHLPNFGVAGTLFISVWGILPAILRLRFNNLSGPVIMHMLNNVFAYLIVVGLGWA